MPSVCYGNILFFEFYRQEMEHEEQGKSGQHEPPLLKSDQTRFVDYSFGNVQTQSLQFTGNLVANSIVTGSPVDGGTVTIPPRATIVILQNTQVYTQLTLVMPTKPDYGQILIIVSTVDVPNLTLSGATFGTHQPYSLTADVPLRFVFAGSWFNI
jgi:hypothetical protein